MRGHSNECWNNTKNKDKSSKASTSQGCIANSLHDSEIMYRQATTSSKGGRRLNDVCIMDLGATWHMTPHRDWFYSYEHIS